MSAVAFVALILTAIGLLIMSSRLDSKGRPVEALVLSTGAFICSIVGFYFSFWGMA